MRRTTALTTVAVLVLTTAATWAMAASASARPSTSRGPGTNVAATKATKAAKVKVKPGSTWTLSPGTRCETDNFATAGKFSASAGATGNKGTYKVKGKKLTMTWTAGSASNDQFVGKFNKGANKYTGTYSHLTTEVPATLVPAAKGGCDVVSSAAQETFIGVGQQNDDVASVDGSGGVTPTGTIHFYVCAGSADPCTPSTKVQDLGTISLAGSGGTASAISELFSPTDTGAYCFLAEYSGDNHYPAGSDGSTADECFTVFSGGG
jgi:hypothetical protein